MKHFACGVALAVGVAVAGIAQAQGTEETKGGEGAAVRAFVDSLEFRDGQISVPAAHATLDLGNQFRFLPKADARRVLEELWGNPEDDSVLGLVVPAAEPLASEHSWAVVLTYSDDGHVTDDDASAIDYGELLGEMKAGAREENQARREAGYPTVEIVGWAKPPRYDAGAKKLHWAREIAFEGADENSLNYDIRVLGREGYLSMNAVASMSDLERVSQGMEQLLPRTSFVDGHRYADFNDSTDRIAGYGIAALVGGTIAAKSGLFAKLVALLIAGKKLVILAVAGIGVALRKLFQRGGGDKAKA